MNYADEKMRDTSVPERVIDDPWIHRSEGMRCHSCMWYVEKENNAIDEIRGRCRRHCPTMGGFPVVFPIDWCGDHRLK